MKNKKKCVCNKTVFASEWSPKFEQTSSHNWQPWLLKLKMGYFPKGLVSTPDFCVCENSYLQTNHKLICNNLRQNESTISRQYCICDCVFIYKLRQDECAQSIITCRLVFITRPNGGSENEPSRAWLRISQRSDVAIFLSSTVMKSLASWKHLMTNAVNLLAQEP